MITFNRCFWYFIIMGKSFIEVSANSAKDGLSQHFTFFDVLWTLSKKLLFGQFFIEHTFQIPIFDFNIGFGDDIVNTLSYYVMGDPFALLSVFVPMDKTGGIISFPDRCKILFCWCKFFGIL